jgi:TPR repeat protein
LKKWKIVLVLAGLSAFYVYADFNVQLLIKQATDGMPGAQFDLAEKYSKGDGVEQDRKAAAEWFEKAAVQNLPKAQYELAMCYAEGKGVQQDHQQAIHWLNQAAGFYFAPAQYQLGKSFEQGNLGLSKDLERAVKWMRLASSQALPESFYALGTYYLAGQGVAENEAKAVEWFQRGAKQANEDCIHIVANHFNEWSHYLTDQTPYLDYFIAKAESGDADAQLMLGQIYRGDDADDQRLKEAVIWLAKAAEQGNTEANKLLVDHYLNGKGVPKNRELALQHCENVALTGDVACQEQLAGMYAESGTEDDLKASLNWYLQAAKQGRQGAQIKCIFIYGKGTGVPPNRAEAYAWALVVGQNGKKAYERSLEPILTVEEKMKAMKRYRALLREMS